MSKRVKIVHPDGREYGIPAAAFSDKRLSPEGSYAERGFEIVSHEDGTPFEGPKSKREIEAAAAERQAAREDKPAEKPKSA